MHLRIRYIIIAALAAFFIVTFTSASFADTNVFTNMDNAAEYAKEEIMDREPLTDIGVYAKSDKEAYEKGMDLEETLQEDNTWFDDGYSKTKRYHYFRGGTIDNIYVNTYRVEKNGSCDYLDEWNLKEKHYKPELYKMEIFAAKLLEKDEENRYEKRVKKLIKKLKLKRLSRYRKIVKVAKWIEKNVEYKIDPDDYYCHTPYGALINKEAVCDGKSRLFYDILRRSGVPCRVVRGKAYDMGSKYKHAWNMVELKGKWYHIDVTWIHSYDVEHTKWFLRGKKDFKKHKAKFTKREKRTFKFANYRYEKG